MRRVLSSAIASALLLLLMAPLTGCLQDDVGVVCEHQVDEDSKETSFNLQALDCESRVCVAYGGSTPRCTMPCEDDSDCPDEGVAGCNTGFVCRIGTPFGGVSCCKFCVCNDFASADEDQNLLTQCKTIPTKCPNI